MDYEEFYSLWREPVTFRVEILEARYFRAEHRKGEQFIFSWNTPREMCGEAFVGMYPLLVSLRTGGDMTLLGSDEPRVRVYTCPSRVVKFKIEAVDKCPLYGNTKDLTKLQCQWEGT
ncbi:MAG: TIGR04076 family protein [Candidatus Methanofastidiosia archaeon]